MCQSSTFLTYFNMCSTGVKAGVSKRYSDESPVSKRFATQSPSSYVTSPAFDHQLPRKRKQWNLDLSSNPIMIKAQDGGQVRVVDPLYVKKEEEDRYAITLFPSRA